MDLGNVGLRLGTRAHRRSARATTGAQGLRRRHHRHSRRPSQRADAGSSSCSGNRSPPGAAVTVARLRVQTPLLIVRQHAQRWCNFGGAIMPLTHRDLWDTRHLMSVLGARAMPEWQVFLYFLAITTFDWLQFTAFRLRPNQPLSSSSQFDAWFGFGMTVIGVVFLFLCNGGGRGQDFLYRYFP